MGLLRLFLAVNVFVWHYEFVPHIWFPHSFKAVLCFFIISGFYMAMVLDTKYMRLPFGVVRFYGNRLIRLYPTYIAAYLLFYVLAANGWASMGPPPLAFDRATFDQLALLPDSLWNTLTLNTTTAANHLIFAQMLTVAIELMFYAVAPLLVGLRLWALMSVLLAALLLHLWPLWAGLPARQWQYEFFPGVLVFFIAGMLAYRGYAVLLRKGVPAAFGWLAVIPIGIGLASKTAPLNTPGGAVFYIVFAMSVPFLFLASKASTWDRWLGDLSYPLYVCHPIGVMFAWSAWRGTPYEAFVAVGATVVMSVALLLCVDRPSEAVRAWISSGRRPATAPALAR